MSKQQKKFEKKKEREREVQAKLLRRWQAKKAEERKQKEWEEKMEKETNPHNRKPKPFIKGQTTEEPAIPEEALQQAQIRAKLEHNLQILRALEQEYQAEQENKKTLNQNLEAQGAYDLKAKLDMMQEMTLNYAKEAAMTQETPSEETTCEQKVGEAPVLEDGCCMAPASAPPNDEKVKFKGKFQEAAGCCKGRLYSTEAFEKAVETSNPTGQVHEASAKCITKKKKST